MAEFILKVEHISYQYLKFTITNVSFMSIKPSIIAANAVKFGFNHASKHILTDDNAMIAYRAWKIIIFTLFESTKDADSTCSSWYRYKPE